LTYGREDFTSQQTLFSEAFGLNTLQFVKLKMSPEEEVEL